MYVELAWCVTQALSQGDVVLSVPMDVCIIRQLDAQDALTGKESECLHGTTMQERQRGGSEVGRDGIYRKYTQ